jgi:hypothetical protein
MVASKSGGEVVAKGGGVTLKNKKKGLLFIVTPCFYLVRPA